MKDVLFISALSISCLVFNPSDALANDFSFAGNFAVDNSLQIFEFTLPQARTVTIRSLGYGGGTNANGQPQTGGGFDPVLTLFGADGAWIATNNDGPFGFDSELISTLSAGKYTVAISQFDNFAVADGQPGGSLSDGFTGTTVNGFAGRSSLWAVDILNVDSARKLAAVESKVVPPDANRFLTFFSAVSPAQEENEASARAYYATIDPLNAKTTLGEWKTANGLDSGADGDAIYVNNADLGFGRHMYVKTLTTGVASYVENYSANTLDPSNPGGGPADEKISNAHNATNLLATVAMEYTAHPNDPANRKYTKFYVFSAAGNRLTKVDLDGRGAKYIPGACNVCHGGNPRPLLTDGTYADFGDTGAGFLPWDLDVLGFSNTLFGGQYSRSSQETVLKAFNAAVLQTNPTNAAREVIEGWYGGSELPDATFNEHFVPVGWQDKPNYYLDVIAPNCRACHIMRNPAVNFSTFAKFQNLNGQINDLVFNRGVMPLAKRTYERFWRDEIPGIDIARASTDSAGNQSIAPSIGSFYPVISADGRFVAFMSEATDLVTGDTNATRDIFLKDTQTGLTTRLSTDSGGGQSNNLSDNPSISADGRYVVFESDADNLVINDTNGFADIFLKDTQTGVTTLISTDSAGNPSNNDSLKPSVSADGRYVVFQSFANNLVTGDSGFDHDIFLKDTQTGETTMLSTDSAGNEGDNSSFDPAINADGRYIVFRSRAGNLVTGDTNGIEDIFLKDTQTGETTRISTDSAGIESNGQSNWPAISADGRYVAFWSAASNLVTGDTNFASDIFLKDTQTGATTRVSTDSAGNQRIFSSYNLAISPDGRYVAFESTDIFVKDTQTGFTTRVSTDKAGAGANGSSGNPSISTDGQYVAFSSSATNLVAADTNSQSDIFVHHNYASSAPQSDVFNGYYTDSNNGKGPGDNGPIAFAISPTGLTGFPLQLDASNSLFANPVNGLSEFEWNMHTKPFGSNATLSSTTAVKTEFIPDLPGGYGISLLVRNGVNYDFGANGATVYQYFPSATYSDAGVDFTTEILPIINNCIGCHNGVDAPAFNAPQVSTSNEAIYRNLIQRVNAINPTQSLLLRKATAYASVGNPTIMTHGGDQQFTNSSPEYNTMLAWLAAGAPREPLPTPFPPSNDNFADARLITGSSGTQPGTNINATKEPDEPVHAGNEGGKSVWWTWTPPLDGTVEISTAGSDFDTVLAVYTGNSIDTLESVVSNNDSDGNLTSLVNFAVTANTTYFIAVDGFHYSGESAARSGAIQLNWNWVLAPTVAFSAATSNTGEDAGTLPVTVTLTTSDGAPSTIPVIVDYTSADGTATAGEDYAMNAGTITFPTGTVNGATHTINVTIIDDLLAETSENFTLTLANPDGASLGTTATHTATIVDNDTDSDSDGVPDNIDNCTLVPNGPLVPDAGGNSQLDTDGDGYGNLCDPDFDNSGFVNASDLAYLKANFFSTDPDADLDGSGFVNAADLAILKQMFFGLPGPSGLAP